MNAANRRAQRRPVLREGPRTWDGNRAPACPPLSRPVGLEIAARRPRFRPEEPLKASQGQLAACGMRQPHEASRGVATDETEQHPGPPVRRGVVECRRDGAVQGQSRSAEPVTAPERLVVHRRDLEQGALWQALGELVALWGQYWIAGAAPGEGVRNGDDDLFRACV